MCPASNVASYITQCLIACLRSRGFSNLTSHVAPSLAAFIDLYPGLVDVSPVTCPPPWMLFEGSAILGPFAELPVRNSASTLSADTA